MTQLTKDGQNQKMIKSELTIFCNEFIKRSSKYCDEFAEDSMVRLGSKTIKFRVNSNSYHGNLLRQAFIPSSNSDSNFELQVWDASFPEALPDTSFAEDFIISNTPVDFEISSPYRVLFDRGQGMIFVYDTEKHVGAVWMRDHSQIDVRCCVAPFRVILSWMADSFNAEIIHASAAEINGKGVLISGSSGSGKSSLAIYSGAHGGKILSDDAVLIEGSQAHAIYSRAKVAKINPVLNVEEYETFELKNSIEGKLILPLKEFQTSFILKMNYDAIVFPEIVHMTHIERVSSLIGYKYFIEQSLRELFGGDKNNLARHSKLLTKIPNFRMALSGDLAKDYNCLQQQIERL